MENTGNEDTYFNIFFFSPKCYISILLFCKEVQKWSKEFLNHKWRCCLSVYQNAANCPLPPNCGQAHHLRFFFLVRHMGGSTEKTFCMISLSNPLSPFRIKSDIKRNVKQRILIEICLVAIDIISFSLGFCSQFFLFLWIPHQPVRLYWAKPSSPLVAGLCLLNVDECQCHPAH